MGFYLLTALVLWILSTPRVIGSGESGAGLLFSTIIIFLFFAFRYETGFDWMVYQQYFNAVKDSDFMALTGETVSMEPFYYLLNYIISRVGDFQLLLFVVATINIICAFKFFRYFNASTTFCFAFVFCWALLPMWMGTIRQSLAVSMAMIAIIKRVDGKNKSSLIFMMISILFQYSAIMYSFIYFNRVFSYLIKRSSVFVPAFFVFYLISPAGIGQFAVNFISSLGIPFISDKLSIYVKFGASEKSFGAILFSFTNCVLFFYSRKVVNRNDLSGNIFLSAIFVLIATQTLFFDFALIWNRILYLTCFIQAVLVYKILKNLIISNRIIVYFSVVSLSMLSVYKLMSTDASIPFVPYQNYIVSDMFSEKGDGEKRALLYYQLFEENNGK